MNRKLSLIISTLLLCILTVGAQVSFDKYFIPKSLRIDFDLSGNAKVQRASLRQLREEPVWGGPQKNLIDKFGYGGYYVKIFDKTGKTLIYSRGFNTLFEEWRTTDQAKTETQSWTNSVSVPFHDETFCRS